MLFVSIVVSMEINRRHYYRSGLCSSDDGDGDSIFNKPVLTVNFKVEGLICSRRHTIVSNTVVYPHVTTTDACDVQRVARY